MRTLLTLVLSGLSLQAQITFQWDARPATELVTGHNLYEIVGGVTNKIGSTNAATTLTIAAWNFSTSHTVFVTATNMIGESPGSTPLVVPPKASAPVNLTPKPLSLVVPVPGTLEVSPDLQDWKQRIVISPNAESSVLVSQVLYADQPLQFMRVKQPYVPAALPSPSR